MRLFVEDLKGCVDVYDNVYRVSIRKKNNKNVLFVEYNSLKDNDTLLLKYINLAYLVEVYNGSHHEYFRYNKKEVKE